MTPSSKKTNGLARAPWRNTGSPTTQGLLHYAGYEPVEWRPNTPFGAELTVAGIERGRSAAHFVMNFDDPQRPGTRVRAVMFMADMLDLLTSPAEIRNGKVTDLWHVRKRGQNYGLVRVDDAAR